VLFRAFNGQVQQLVDRYLQKLRDAARDVTHAVAHA
jgi:hypothetical protein